MGNEKPTVAMINANTNMDILIAFLRLPKQPSKGSMPTFESPNLIERVVEETEDYLIRGVVARNSVDFEYSIHYWTVGKKFLGIFTFEPYWEESYKFYDSPDAARNSIVVRRIFKELS